MDKSIFEIGAPGIDVDRIVQEVRASVEDKRRRGIYNDARVARAELANLSNLRDEDAFLSFYLECLRDTVFVDISDFEIYERRPRFSRFFIALKRLLWKLLKFYTYRLWSQQNQVNGLLLSAIEGIESRYSRRIAELEKRLAAIESKGGPG